MLLWARPKLRKPGQALAGCLLPLQRFWSPCSRTAWLSCVCFSSFPVSALHSGSSLTFLPAHWFHLYWD